MARSTERPCRHRTARSQRRPCTCRLKRLPKVLAELWQRILRIDRIGTRDNFFASGGHSLLAMQLVGRVRDRLGIDLPLKNLFQRPQLSDLAARIDTLSSTARARQETATGRLAAGFDYGEV